MEVEGIRELLRKLETDRLMRNPIRRFFASIGKRGRDDARDFAPRRTGRLAAKMTYRVSGKAIPEHVAIIAKARAARDFSYPRLLEYSRKHGHLRWLATGLEALMGRIGPELDDAARDVEQEFNRT